MSGRGLAFAAAHRGAAQAMAAGILASIQGRTTLV
jgi:hypothetical protein